MAIPALRMIPRREAAVLNARIRKRWRLGRFPIGVIGEHVDLTYPYEHLGAGPDTLAAVAAGRHDFSELLREAQQPMVLIGQGALARPDGVPVLPSAGAGQAR